MVPVCPHLKETPRPHQPQQLPLLKPLHLSEGVGGVSISKVRVLRQKVLMDTQNCLQTCHIQHQDCFTVTSLMWSRGCDPRLLGPADYRL